MTSNWKECKIEDLNIQVIDGDRGKNYPNKQELLNSGDCLFLSAQNVTKKGFNFNETQWITKEKDSILRNGKLSYGDIVITTRGTVGNVALYSNDIKYTDVRINSGMLIIRCDETLSNKYLYYVLSSNFFAKKILLMQSGTAQPQLPKSHFLKMSIPLPPLETQQKIAKVLSTIDDKIELNNSINKNLEQQAQAIFKEKVIKTCNYEKNGCIGDYVTVKSGFAFKGTWWQDSGIKVIKIKTIDNDTINFKDCSYVSEDKVQYAEDFTVKGGDVLIAMTGATIGKFAIIPRVKETLLVNQRVGKFFLGNNPIEKLPFLYCTLKEQDIISEIINRGQGSAQPNISSTDIMTTPCYLPNKYVIDEFNELCKPIFETIITNKYENEQLANLRDALLPKLMSGEIDVDKVEV